MINIKCYWFSDNMTCLSLNLTLDKNIQYLTFVYLTAIWVFFSFMKPQGVYILVSPSLPSLSDFYKY